MAPYELPTEGVVLGANNAPFKKAHLVRKDRKGRNMSQNMNNTKKWAVTGAFTLIALIGVAAVLNTVLTAVAELWYATDMKDWMALSTPFFLRVFWPLMAICTLVITGSCLALRYRNPKTTEGGAMIIAGVAMLVASFIPGSPTFSAANRSGYEAQRMYLQNLTVTKAPHPEYQIRQNFVQAREILEETLNATVSMEMTQLLYTSVNGDPAWCGGVVDMHDGKGRAYVKGVRCLTADGVVKKADFSGRVPYLYGAHSTNLRKQVAEAKPGLSVGELDVRFAIKGDKAISVVSTTRVVRDANKPHRVPGGVFVFDETGRMTYRSSAKASDFGFQVVPYSIAEEIRGALNTRAGFWCMNNLLKAKCTKLNVPLEDTHHEAGEVKSDDLNAENFSEFALYRKDGSIGLVTPLKAYGSATNVIAYLDVEADSVQDGVMPKATLYTGVSEVSDRILAQYIAPAYTADITWLAEIAGDGESASGSRIYEVTPQAPGYVFATVGTATNPQYDILVKATVSDESLEFSWCISSHNTHKQIECRSRRDGEAPIGTLRGLANNTTNPTEDTTPSGDKTTVTSSFDTSKLSDAEKIALIAQLAKELQR